MERLFNSREDLITFARLAISEKKDGAFAIGIHPLNLRREDCLMIVDTDIEIEPPGWSGTGPVSSPNEFAEGNVHVIRLPFGAISKDDERFNQKQLKSFREHTIWIWKKPEV
jgi:hypothetical protein